MLDTLKALADPTRLRLIGLLAHGELTVQELTGILRMGQSRISRHLKILVDAGILCVQRQGTWGYYRLAGSNGTFRDIWPPLERRLGELSGWRDDLSGLAGVLEERRRRSQDFFDRHALQWDRLSREFLPTSSYDAALVAAVPEGNLLVEIGVGTGGLLAALQRKMTRVIGIDHSRAMLEQARERIEREGLEGIELRLGEMTHIPLSDGEADAAVLNMVLHHAPRPSTVLGEVSRVLSPGGVVIIADLLRHEMEWAREHMADQWLGFEPSELRGWLTEAGLAPEEFRTVPGRHNESSVFIQTARKGQNT